MVGSEVPAAKRCRDCGKVKPASEFWKRKQSPDGLALYCKECFGLRNADSYRGRQGQAGKETRPYRRRQVVPPGMKFCPKCDEVKPVAAFGRNRSAQDGLTSYCLPCHNVATAEIRRRNHGSQRNYMLKRRYGVTEQQVDALLRKQGGICVICLRAPATHVDHNHETGLFRGVLCFSCNGALGQFDDDPRRLRDAATYLESRGHHAERMVLDLGRRTLAARREDGRRNPASKAGSSRHYRLRERYGIGESDERRLIAVQCGLCAICCDSPARDVDHDHVTGAVRGVLCSGCNSGMGQFKDDPVALRRAADYLEGLLITERPAEGGGTRMSFTIPDVDPATVPVGGWEPYRLEDGRNRKAILELAQEMEFFRWLEFSVDGAYPH